MRKIVGNQMDDHGPITLSPGQDQEDLRLLYERTYATASIFFEWRYKVMTFGVSVIAVTLALAEWLFTHGRREYWTLSFPFALSAFVCFALAALDRRNQSILNASYRVGFALEQRLGAPEGAILRQIELSRKEVNDWTYRTVIKLLFNGVGFLFLVAAALAVIWSIGH
jgi:hypothetical protein